MKHLVCHMGSFPGVGGGNPPAAPLLPEALALGGISAVIFSPWWDRALLCSHFQKAPAHRTEMRPLPQAAPHGAVSVAFPRDTSQ